MTTAAMMSSSRPDRRGRVADGEARELHDAGESDEEAGERVDRDLRPRDRDAAEAGRRLVRSDRVGVRPEDGAPEDERHEDAERRP